MVSYRAYGFENSGLLEAASHSSVELNIYITLIWVAYLRRKRRVLSLPGFQHFLSHLKHAESIRKLLETVDPSGSTQVLRHFPSSWLGLVPQADTGIEILQLARACHLRSPPSTRSFERRSGRFRSPWARKPASKCFEVPSVECESCEKCKA